MTTTRGSLVVGTVDAVDALVFFGLMGVVPHRTFQSIVAGLLGRSAFTGGPATLALRLETRSCQSVTARWMGPTARSASAAIVNVGFDAADVGNTPLPSRNRFA